MTRGILVLAALAATAVHANASDTAVSLPQPQTMEELVRMSRADLTALYLAAPPAGAPGGFAPGRAIKNPGSRRTERNSRATGLLWKGKVFRDDGTMVNRLAGGLTAIPADVYLGESLLDGRPSLILDYSRSRLWPDVRDEIREVSPGLYLGIMYRGKGSAGLAAWRGQGPASRPLQMQQKMFFTLDARK